MSAVDAARSPLDSMLPRSITICSRSRWGAACATNQKTGVQAAPQYPAGFCFPAPQSG